MTEEDQAALEHMAQEKRRDAFQKSLQALLKPDPGPAKQTKRNWAPLTKTGHIKGQEE